MNGVKEYLVEGKSLPKRTTKHLRHWNPIRTFIRVRIGKRHRRSVYDYGGYGAAG